MGGTLYLWTRLAQPDGTIVSVDLPGGKFGGGYSPLRTPIYRRFARSKQKLHLMRADSHQPGTLDAVKKLFGGSEIDFLFIDLMVDLNAQTFKVPDGTAIRLSLVESLSSATNEVDNPVHFEVIEDVKVAGNLLIPKGSTAVGHVVEVESRKRMGRAGKINFTVDHVKAPDGSNLRLRAASTRKGEDKTGTVIVGAVVLSPLFLIMRGKDITIPKGTEITAYVEGEREIATSTSSAPVGPTPAASSGTVSLRSTPDGADITVDGKYMGSTPAVLHIAQGEHSILIEKAHFVSWKRTMSIVADASATVCADLEKIQ
jgi:hypothetical protein